MEETLLLFGGGDQSHRVLASLDKNGAELAQVIGSLESERTGVNMVNPQQGIKNLKIYREKVKKH